MRLHIPVGRPVMIRGTSNDVIHSFWVPNLQGKRDLIPSRITTEWIQADRPGRFRGQCAEFCGLATRAHGSLGSCRAGQTNLNAGTRASSNPPRTRPKATKSEGGEVFLNSACVLCHTIQGTTASGQVGPDLTHFGSRLTIAAGTPANNKGNLAAGLPIRRPSSPAIIWRPFRSRPRTCSP